MFGCGDDCPDDCGGYTEHVSRETERRNAYRIYQSAEAFCRRAGGDQCGDCGEWFDGKALDTEKLCQRCSKAKTEGMRKEQGRLIKKAQELHDALERRTAKEGK